MSGAVHTPGPLPVEVVIKALRAMDAEARKRGAMFPQTREEQEADTAAVRKVIASLEFYGSPRQRGADGGPTINDWPALPLPEPIAQCVNAHDGLVKALRKAIETTYSDTLHAEWTALLAKATGSQP